ncbi:phage tail assembly chaperone [Pseudomonas cichorii]|uniref:phage tail assembly chaperone n=1 Tax=Pseudomonas cichorii TaxID=36746 RepID=UPI001C88CC04|nr:phage tail assembly chaperone [Pseudomonas cichorii]MBX8488058.1 phage tail assembly chaperone [Pseudomonas cichorii]MBX8542122.1 phage tail assembly chaperone [Pseudomonas cichorii]MBX8561914.1 phage tail assembly chaperone [Pseudomonas cichorii]MBX8566773.1 phage tail assembly chaperone [Pseudomonas cichorii]MBX8576518.1 phage tail assembly chaperone [Pseudomonas cichorii]
MAIFYCAETGGFYLSGMQPVGKDCKEITDAQHVELRAANAAGKIIAADADGFPVAVDPPGLTTEQLQERERGWRDHVLLAASGVRDRHRDQLELKLPTTLDAEQFSELLVYIQSLRDWPQAEAFPDNLMRPAAPAWLETN